VSEVRKDRLAQKHEPAGSTAKTKRPYQKPGFQHEKVFETMALACGKIAGTQAQCHLNRKLS
jgi:hypothetical protein